MQAHSFLDNFVQLIQLWAGICLLFFYNPFLEDSPLENKLNELDKRFKRFISSHQAVAIFGESNEEKVYDPTKWRNFVPRIRNMAALTFFYCVFLLVYIGVQKSWCDFYSVKHPSFLLLANILIIFYVIICFIVNHKFFHKYRTPVLYIIGIFFIFRYYEFIHKPIEWINTFFRVNLEHRNTWFWVTAITLIVCILAMLMLIGRIWANNLVVKQKVSALQRLDLKFNELEDIINEIIRVDSFNQLSDSAKGVVKPLLSVDEEMFQKKKQQIINELCPTHFLEASNKKFIEDLKKHECYEDLECNTKKFIYSVCDKYHLFRMDASQLMTKITSQMKDDYHKEKFEEALFPRRIKSSHAKKYDESLQNGKGVQSENAGNTINQGRHEREEKLKESRKDKNDQAYLEKKQKNMGQSSKKRIRDILNHKSSR